MKICWGRCKRAYPQPPLKDKYPKPLLKLQLASPLCLVGRELACQTSKLSLIPSWDTTGYTQFAKHLM